MKLLDLYELKIALDPGLKNPVYNAWSFGQIIAIALLVSPLLAVLRRLLTGNDDVQEPHEIGTERPSYVGTSQNQEWEMLLDNSDTQPQSGSSHTHSMITGQDTRVPLLDLADLLTTIDEPASERSAWFRACLIPVCMLWTSVSAIALFFATLSGKFWEDEVNSLSYYSYRYNFVQLWFLTGSLAWFLLVFYPIIFALLVGIGLRQCKPGKRSPRHALRWYTGLCFTTNVALVVIIALIPHAVFYAAAVAGVVGVYVLVITWSWVMKIWSKSTRPKVSRSAETS